MTTNNSDLHIITKELQLLLLRAGALVGVEAGVGAGDRAEAGAGVGAGA